MLWFHFNAKRNLSNCEWLLVPYVCVRISNRGLLLLTKLKYIGITKRQQTCFNESPVPKALCTAASQLNLGFSNFSSSFQSNPIGAVRKKKIKCEKKYAKTEYENFLFVHGDWAKNSRPNRGKLKVSVNLYNESASFFLLRKELRRNGSFERLWLFQD